MRSNVSEFRLEAAPTLEVTLALLSLGKHTPIAGGTELMVALSAGRLPQKHLLSINHLRELRFIEVTPTTITIGSGATFTDIRRNAVIASDFPLLSQAASWTGSIANQNRGTIGGNIVNASPAADSPPALLAYDATLTVISSSGTRTIPYTGFHLSYKKTALRPEELLHSISIKRNFSGYKTYIRKVGARDAQAISKIALACLARTTEPAKPASGAVGDARLITDIRIGAASLRETPTRCTAAEQALLNQPLTPATLPTLIASARAALATEARPIDDIRSTAKYRAAVAANLLEEFLRNL
ncbi:MAG: FAD binding domain-containing protein [Acidobacteriaceae bacterium]|jgi:CO/xanthine dehydrogenase FAD-binding subunit